ncbi:MAG TPA: head maturation protease, ClpP-related [Umezawaea sp.]|nr:head maturation protease, ClpP-related [Umezawaea sp.]
MRDTRYRFNGRMNPTDRTKVGVRAELMTGEGDTAGSTKLYLYDPIDSYGGYWGVSAREFVEALAALPANTNEIRLHINSPGGEVFEGIAIANALRNHPARVVAVVDGLAASAASFVATAADEVIMGQNTEMMIHDAWGICIGPAEDMDKMSERLKALSDNIASIYQAKAGGDVADWRALMLAETWYSADEAVAAGLADSVASAPAPAEPAAAAAAFDLEGMFTYPGRAAAPPPAAAVRPATPAAAATDPEAAPLPGPDYAARFRARRHEQRARTMAG